LQINRKFKNGDRWVPTAAAVCSKHFVDNHPPAEHLFQFWAMSTFQQIEQKQLDRLF